MRLWGGRQWGPVCSGKAVVVAAMVAVVPSPLVGIHLYIVMVMM